MFNSIQNLLSLDAEKELQNRDNPSSREMIYPWNNYDFNYSQIIANKYTPKKLGISDKPYLDTFIKDLEKIPKYPTLIVNQPLIDKDTIPGKSDIENNNSKLTGIKKTYDEKFKEPYPGFKTEYPEYFPLTGERSSSYFVKIGSCPVKSKKNKNECQENGYQWVTNTNFVPNDFYSKKESSATSGSCFKPRYLYINNQPKEVFGLKGPITTITKDASNLNPLDLIGIFTNGKSSNKEMRPLPCIEGFTNYKNKPHNLLLIVLIFIIFILITITLH